MTTKDFEKGYRSPQISRTKRGQTNRPENFSLKTKSQEGDQSGWNRGRAGGMGSDCPLTIFGIYVKTNSIRGEGGGRLCPPYYYSPPPDFQTFLRHWGCDQSFEYGLHLRPDASHRQVYYVAAGCIFGTQVFSRDFRNFEPVDLAIFLVKFDQSTLSYLCMKIIMS
jgi:hypothetical protein